ncbi:Agamous-like MADS-box protein AGL29 [Linum perenne]
MAETENNIIPAKKTKGRQKIPLQKIEDPIGRAITFSKRRRGIYKKASELVTLCGAEIAILVFSPGGKPFSFGSPDVDSITNQFLNQNEGPSTSGKKNNQSSRAAKKMNKELDSLHCQVEAEKQKGKTLKEKLMALGGSMFVKPISKMRLDELHEMKERLLMLQRELDGRAMEMDAPSTLLLLSGTQGVEEAENLDDPDVSYCSE